MKISCVQMSVAFGRPEDNFRLAKELIAEAMLEQPDVIVLPETWNTGFFPRKMRQELADRDCARVREEIGALAKEYHVNIVAGSVANLRDGKVYNTACIFDRDGSCIAQYDKTHLFSAQGEDTFFTPGNRLCRFELDGIPCAIVICYDVRFPELIRSLTVQGVDLLFVVAQWAKSRTSHLRALTVARAIENQMFLACCNACGAIGLLGFGGNSAIINPRGETLALAGPDQEILTADCDFSTVQHIRTSINVFADRRPELYRV